MQAVWIAEDPLPPAVEEAPVAIEDDHRVRAAIEQEDAVLAVDRDRGDVAELDPGRQLAPTGQRPIGPLALPENHASARNDIVHRLMLTRPGMNSNLFWFLVDNGKSSLWTCAIFGISSRPPSLASCIAPPTVSAAAN